MPITSALDQPARSSVNLPLVRRYLFGSMRGLCLFALLGLAAACRANVATGPTPTASTAQPAAPPASANSRAAATPPSASSPNPPAASLAVAVAPATPTAGSVRVESHGVTLAVSANDLTLTQNHE